MLGLVARQQQDDEGVRHRRNDHNIWHEQDSASLRRHRLSHASSELDRLWSSLPPAATAAMTRTTLLSSSHHLSRSSSTIAQQQQQVRRNVVVVSLPVPSIIAHMMKTVGEFCWTCCEIGWELTTCRIVPSKTVLYRMSVIAIACDRVMEDWCWHLQQQRQQQEANTPNSVFTTSTFHEKNNTTNDSCITGFSFSPSTATCTTTSTTTTLLYILWTVFFPLLFMFVIWIAHRMVSTELFWPHRRRRRHHHQQQQHHQQAAEEVILITALVSLLCLEALVPLTILGCISLILLHQVSGTTAIVIMGGVYLFSSTTTRWIRCLLYSYIGGRE